MPYQAWLSILAIASAVLFVGSLFIAPLLLARIPADYFAHDTRPPSAWAHRHRAIRITLLITRNTLGTALILAGIAMLALPGQGLLTILAGFLLLDFPGKYALEKRLLAQRWARAPIDWLRRRRGRPPLQIRTAADPSTPS